jgi:hypothetical protein
MIKTASRPANRDGYRNRRIRDKMLTILERDICRTGGTELPEMRSLFRTAASYTMQWRSRSERLSQQVPQYTRHRGRKVASRVVSFFLRHGSDWLWHGCATTQRTVELYHVDPAIYHLPHALIDDKDIRG